MAGQELVVRMLGVFSLEADGRRIDDGGDRSRKVWLLLAYLICNRGGSLPESELISLLNRDGEGGGDPSNALRAILHRARAMLNQLWPSAGHELIVRENGGYAWNTRFPLRLDVEEFDALCASARAAASAPARLDGYCRALELYRGDFLPRLFAEPWVVPICAYYHSLYLNAASEALALLEEDGQARRAAEVCSAALRVEPCSEELYRYLMRALLDMGDQAGAAAAYEEMSAAFRSRFGVMPGEETRRLYYEAVNSVNGTAVPFEVLLSQLQEDGAPAGALICDYDFFKVLYRSTARAMARSGDAVHIAQISLSGKGGTTLTERSLNRAMDNLQEQIRVNLRRGDAAARCSVSQFVLMLPRADYENSRMVCGRIVKAFCRRYPHSPARLRFTVRALEARFP